MARVTFVNEARSVEVPEGTSVLQAGEKAGVPILRGMWRELHCGRGLMKGVPLGVCGRCRVWATGNLEEPTRAEKWRLPEGGQLRFACLAVVRGDSEVTTRPGWEFTPHTQ